MTERPLPFRRIVFVCTNDRGKGDRVSCAHCGEKLRERLKDLVKKRGLKGKVRISESGCMDRCEDGPNIMIFPDNVWLSGVKESDLPAILDRLAKIPHRRIADQSRDRRHFMPLLTLLFAIAILGAALVPIIEVMYSYNTATLVESVVGFLVMLAVAGFFWAYRRRRAASPSPPNFAIPLGVILGLLWAVEIGINNFIAPPLPARDNIDNAFWAIIALVMFLSAIVFAYRADSIARGLNVGAWSGFVSGLIACCTPLLLIVFGMRFITSDPLNIDEWAARPPDTPAPTIAAYFAYETLTGAFLHLTVLGLAMGTLLGLIGGLLGKGLKHSLRLARQSN